MPLTRHAAGSTPYNVVIFLLESWSAAYVDAFSNGSPLGLTPNMDRMARDGIMFPNFHSSGQRSFEGVPAVPDRPASLARRADADRRTHAAQTHVGALATREGVRPIFHAISEPGRSLRLDSVAHALGFPRGLRARGAMRACSSRTQIRTPFVTVSITKRCKGWPTGWHREHRRFPGIPVHRFDARALRAGGTGATWQLLPQAVPKNGMYDVIDYADWSIGQFMRARAAGAVVRRYRLHL